MKPDLLKQASTTLRILYPIWAAVGIIGIVYIPSQLVVAGNAELTAHNIASNELLFRSGIAASLVTQLLFIVVVLVLYRFFELTNKTHALLMVILALVSVPISMLNSLNRVAALHQLNNPEQMMFFLNLNRDGITIASIFWGLWLFPLGYLIYKSGYFPKVIGIAVLIGGVGYTVGSFTKIIAPHMEGVIAISEYFTFGEIIWLLWLIIRGPKWLKEQTA